MVYRTYFIRIIIIFYLFHSLLYSFYDIGDTISLVDQNIEYDICHGAYESDKIKFLDFNGEINGGNFMVLGLLIQATW